MIAVLGRPELDERGALAGIASRIALAAAAAGGAVEVVGTIADDAAGDRIVVLLGDARVGHAALLRVPERARPLEPADVELALRYLPDCRVVVVAGAIASAAAQAAFEGARYNGAQLVVVQESAAGVIEAPADATVLTQPDEDAGAFADLVGRYAARLDGGTAPADAWRDAIAATGWEAAPA